MVYDTAPSSKRWTERLGLKNRKRKKTAVGNASCVVADSTVLSRRPYDQPGPRCEGSRSLYCSRVDIENKENGDPFGDNGESVAPVNERLAPSGCSNATRARSAGLSTLMSSVSSSSSSYFIPRRIHHPPLPPIPGEGENLNSSIYIKELDGSQCELLDSDYLPLSEVLSPLQEDASTDKDTSPTSSESTDISVGTYEVLVPPPKEPQPTPKLRGSETFPVLRNPEPRTLLQTLRAVQIHKRPSAKPSALRRLYSGKTQTSPSSSCRKYSSRASCQSSTSSKGTSSCSVGSTASSVISTGPGFNKAFISSAGSLASQHHGSSDCSPSPHYHALPAYIECNTEQRVPPIYHPGALTPPSLYQTSVPNGAFLNKNPTEISPSLRRSSPSGACLLGVLSPAQSLDSSGSIFVSSMSEASSPSLTSMVAMRGGVKGVGGGDPYSLDADDEEEITQDDITQVTQETMQGDGTQWCSQEDASQWDSQEISQEESMQEDFDITQENEPGVTHNPPEETRYVSKNNHVLVATCEEPSYVNACRQLVAFQEHQQREDPVLRVLPTGQTSQPFGPQSARVSEFRQRVVTDPDPYDTMEDEGYLELDNLQGVPIEDARASQVLMHSDSASDDNCDDNDAAAVVIDNNDAVGNVGADVNEPLVCPSSSASEFLGCMSFGVQHLVKKVE